mmetsp:Transcript_14128/g.30789  ORF Transcript_14128/g.30789 Transcript_14128/m.30789 type:complete len:563 (+) Transcript_14128:49-1737(+)|eukprot:CAMPEP_0168734140 /NCGR_PEP_ID=MMETSP0724-20121128/8657_1 /TAXON_ID=265536 /ORGANISM="Amphiprora sp., Strain CCMP467" /LENGTH=562 /DNA_ID=CAMNT_0008781229 /DNA_START=437 /DNA_END=2125 /DNA_ORIENTATION=-
MALLEQQAVPEITGGEAIPMRMILAEKNAASADGLTSTTSTNPRETMAVGMLQQQQKVVDDDDEPEVDTRCQIKVPIHVTNNNDKNLPLPWNTSPPQDSPTSVLKPRLTLSAFRKPAANMTQTDQARTLERLYDLNRAGCSGVLGHGAFSTVRLAVRNDDARPVAVKIIAKHEALRSRRLRAGRHLEEWEILRKMKGNEFIIQLLDVFETDEEIQLVMELCKGGELFNAIQRKRNRNFAMRRGQYTEEQAACITSQILRALNDLHAEGIVHRDVKLENILLESCEDDNHVRVKLCDFGMARSLEPTTGADGSKRKQGDISPITPGRSRSNSVIGSNYYVAPELTCGTYDTAVDIYSLGVTLYILLCGFPPVFTGPEGDQVTFPDCYWKDVSAEAKDLVCKMLQPDASSRITAHEALRDVWVWKHRHFVTRALAVNAASNSNKINLDLVRRRLCRTIDRSQKKKRSRSSAVGSSDGRRRLLMSPKRARLSDAPQGSSRALGDNNAAATNATSASSALLALADLYRDVAQSPSAKVISSVVAVESSAADPSGFARSPHLPTLSV